MSSGDFKIKNLIKSKQAVSRTVPLKQVTIGTMDGPRSQNGDGSAMDYNRDNR